MISIHIIRSSEKKWNSVRIVDVFLLKSRPMKRSNMPDSQSSTPLFSTQLRATVATCLLVIAVACGPVNVAERTDTISRTLTVREIDKDARRFTVTGGGERFVLRASEDVRNFDQISVGDKLNFEYVESVALSMAVPEDSGDTFVIGGAAVAPEGQQPSAVAVGLVSAVVEFLSYDKSTQTVVFRSQSGDIFSTKVAPEMRRFAASRKAGDRVVVNYATGIAVNITSAS